ncbi:sporulation protein YunB [Priestia abyssalis]|uniref:sporulation protein YunB n=1 Tax=Priestia abyssalis TaxID=1221450 RepID=UPI0009950B09|nr:sporulation protein YunB [Priestia abyssalis]
MRRIRIKRPRKGPLPFRYVFLLTFVFFMLSTAAGIWMINRGIEPTLMSYAETQTKRIASLVISKAINKKVAEELDANELIKIETDDKGEIATIDINTAIVNRVLAQTTHLVQANLKEAEKGNLAMLEIPTDIEIETDEKLRQQGIVYQIPLGQATNNALLGNLGPLIPVKFNAIGDVRSDAKEVIEPFGINNALIKVFIEVEVNVQVIIPFATRVATVKTNIPVAMRVIQGKVPDFYNSGGDSSPSIEIPAN